LGSRERTHIPKGPLIWPGLLVLVGGLLLLANFFLLGDFQLIQLWPLLLVLVGVQVLLRGDLLLSSETRPFGITRGSLESSTLEINAAEVDVRLRALPARSAERLIAGQYALQSRPDLHAEDTHAHLIFQREKTPWYNQADWELGLSTELPWQVLVGASLGQVEMDLRDVIVQEVRAATGIGDIRCVAPGEAFQPLHLTSTLGSIFVEAPDDTPVTIRVNPGRFSQLHVNEQRYEEVSPGVYRSRTADEPVAPVEFILRSSFGNIHLL